MLQRTRSAMAIQKSIQYKQQINSWDKYMLKSDSLQTTLESSSRHTCYCSKRLRKRVPNCIPETERSLPELSPGPWVQVGLYLPKYRRNTRRTRLGLCSHHRLVCSTFANVCCSNKIMVTKTHILFLLHNIIFFDNSQFAAP